MAAKSYRGTESDLSPDLSGHGARLDLRAEPTKRHRVRGGAGSATPQPEPTRHLTTGRHESVPETTRAVLRMNGETAPKRVPTRPSIHPDRTHDARSSMATSIGPRRSVSFRYRRIRGLVGSGSSSNSSYRAQRPFRSSRDARRMRASKTWSTGGGNGGSARKCMRRGGRRLRRSSNGYSGRTCRRTPETPQAGLRSISAATTDAASSLRMRGLANHRSRHTRTILTAAHGSPLGEVTRWRRWRYPSPYSRRAPVRPIAAGSNGSSSPHASSTESRRRTAAAGFPR